MISICITTYGADHWPVIAQERAHPSALAQNAWQVILHHEPNLTIGPARNAAAEHATGEWLLFLDADDELEPGYVDAMTNAICSRQRPEPALLQPAVRYVRNHRVSPAYLVPEQDLRHTNYLVVGTVLRRELFEQVGGFSDYPHGFEDWSLWAKSYQAGARVFPVPQAIYRAYINAQSAHHKLWRDRKTQAKIHARVAAELFPETT